MYESRLYIVNAQTVKAPNGGETVLSSEIAVYECGMMPDDFTWLFKAGGEINFDLYVPGCNEDGEEVMVFTREDCYGEHCRMIRPDLLIKYIESHSEELANYRRSAPLLGLLKGFDPNQWENLMVVHYGH